MIGITISICLLGIFTLLSGIFSASETALFSLSKMKVRSYRQSTEANKQLIANLVMRPRELLVTILMLNIAINILIQNVSSNLFDDFSGWLLKVGVPLCLTLVFGEIIPKSVAIQNNAQIAKRMAPILHRLRRVLGPIRVALTEITSIVSSTVFFFLKNEKDISQDELKHVLKKSQDLGMLHSDEAELIKGYLQLQDATVKELMRPREEIIFYNTRDSIDNLIHYFVDQECSRVPVCEGDLNDVLGIITARLFFMHRNEIQTKRDLSRFLKKPFFVPETTLARNLLRQFEQKRMLMALVVDEYGAISGLVTREDLLEAVVGEIVDRRDSELSYTRADDNVIIASGKLELVEFENLFGYKLDSPNKMVTIGGWLTEQLGDIPKSGTNYVTEHFLFHILAAEPTRIRRVYIRRISQMDTFIPPKTKESEK